MGLTQGHFPTDMYSIYSMPLMWRVMESAIIEVRRLVSSQTGLYGAHQYLAVIVLSLYL